jgi:hypothetical protein
MTNNAFPQYVSFVPGKITHLAYSSGAENSAQIANYT